MSSQARRGRRLRLRAGSCLATHRGPLRAAGRGHRGRSRSPGPGPLVLCVLRHMLDFSGSRVRACRGALLSVVPGTASWGWRCAEGLGRGGGGIWSCVHSSGVKPRAQALGSVSGAGPGSVTRSPGNPGTEPSGRLCTSVSTSVKWAVMALASLDVGLGLCREVPLGILPREPHTPLSGHQTLVRVYHWAPHHGHPGPPPPPHPSPRGVGWPYPRLIEGAMVHPLAQELCAFPGGDIAGLLQPCSIDQHPLHREPGIHAEGGGWGVHGWPRGGRLYWLSGLISRVGR